MTRVLVTGGAGFVGRHIVQRCKAEGYHVTVWDDLSTGTAPHRQPKAFVPPDLFFHGDVRHFVKGEKADEFDIVFHCAAVVGGRLKIEGDPIGVAVDLAIDADVINWIVKAKKRPKLIYFSSSAAYPVWLQKNLTKVQLQEDLLDFDSQKLSWPDMTYGWAKLTGEYLVHHAVRTHGIDAAIYRPFSGYGLDQSFDYPFPSIVRRAVRREDPLVIWGSGFQRRDFIHIDDVVDAVFATHTKLPPGGVLNLGTGIGTAFRELAELACKTVGYNPQIVCDTTKPEGVFYRVAHAGRLNEYYTLQRSLGQGVLECAHWITQVDTKPAEDVVI